MPVHRVGGYQTGDVIDEKYELLYVLSQGGMGSVWVAYNRGLGVHVAVKLVRSDLQAEHMTERFLNEARVSAQLEHPAIIGVHDLGNTERGEPYLVMELLHGEDLRSVLDREERLTPTEAVRLLLPIADGLATAHAKGVVHRDLKPENIFIAELEDRIQPKILDFGIAKPPSTSEQRRLTKAGAVVGSPDYLSPEQARGQDDVDHRADLWSFCVLLYECISGEPPYAHSSFEALLQDIIEKPVLPLAELRARDADLWRILDRGLAKNRDVRWRDMRELGRALARWLRQRGVDEDVSGQSLRALWLRNSSPSIHVTGSIELSEAETHELLRTEAAGAERPRAALEPTERALWAPLPPASHFASMTPATRRRSSARWLLGDSARARTAAYVMGAVGGLMVGIWSLIGTALMDAGTTRSLRTGVADVQPLAHFAAAPLGRIARTRDPGERGGPGLGSPPVCAVPESEQGELRSSAETEAAQSASIGPKRGARQRVYVWRKAANGESDLGL